MSLMWYVISSMNVKMHLFLFYGHFYVLLDRVKTNVQYRSENYNLNKT